MKKPATGKKKQVQIRNARKRFVTKKERANRRKRFQDHLKYQEKLKREYNDLLMEMMTQQFQELQNEAETNDALFDGEESENNN